MLKADIENEMKKKHPNHMGDQYVLYNLLGGQL